MAYPQADIHLNAPFSMPGQGQDSAQVSAPSTPYAPPPQNSITDAVLDSHTLLIKLMRRLGGMFEVIGKDSKISYEIDQNKRIVNDNGIHEIMLFLEPIVAKETKIAQLSEDLVYQKFIMMKNEFLDIAFQNYERWELKSQNWDNLIATVGEIIFEQYSGIVLGRILRSITPNQSEIHQYSHTDSPATFIDRVKSFGR